MIEIMNEDDQELVIHVTRSAEEYFEDPQKSYWWTGLEAPGEDEGHMWTWITSELSLIFLSGEGRPIAPNVGRQSVSQFTLFKIHQVCVCLLLP